MTWIRRALAMVQLWEDVHLTPLAGTQASVYAKLFQPLAVRVLILLFWTEVAMAGPAGKEEKTTQSRYSR